MPEYFATESFQVKAIHRKKEEIRFALSAPWSARPGFRWGGHEYVRTIELTIRGHDEERCDLLDSWISHESDFDRVTDEFDAYAQVLIPSRDFLRLSNETEIPEDLTLLISEIYASTKLRLAERDDATLDEAPLSPEAEALIGQEMLFVEPGFCPCILAIIIGDYDFWDTYAIKSFTERAARSFCSEYEEH